MRVDLLSAHDIRRPVLLRMQLVPPRETKISGASKYLDDLEAGPLFGGGRSYNGFFGLQGR